VDVGGARRDGTPQVTTYTFTVSGTTLTGKVTSTRGGQEMSQDITEGKVSGDEIGFVVVRTMGDMTMKTTYKGKVAGSEIHLTREMAMLLAAALRAAAVVAVRRRSFSSELPSSNREVYSGAGLGCPSDLRNRLGRWLVDARRLFCLGHSGVLEAHYVEEICVCYRNGLALIVGV